MASKRMFTMQIVDSDAFVEMPISTQGLYFQFAMRADDDGFIDKPKRIMRDVKAKAADYDRLLENGFILEIDRVVVIKHWRMHNSLSQNRYHETQYLEEKAKLLLKDNGSYSLNSGVPLDDTKYKEQKKETKKNNKPSGKRLATGSTTASRIEGKYSENKALDKAFYDYVEMRKKIKKPMTDRAVELAKSKLEKLSKGNIDVAVAILNQSVMNSWQGLFELKERSVSSGCTGSDGAKSEGTKDEYADELERAVSGV